MSEHMLTHTDELLAQLSSLDDEDRAWLIGRLSPRQRTVLMDLASAERRVPASSASTSAATESAEEDAIATAWQAMRRAKPEEIVALLADEPAWLAQTVLAIEDWRWRDEVALQLLPTSRSSAPQMQQLPVLVRNALVKQCAARLPRYGSIRPRSRTRTLFGRVGKFLVDRRLALRA